MRRKNNLTVIVRNVCDDIVQGLHLVFGLGLIVLVNEVLQLGKTLHVHLELVTKVGNLTIPAADRLTLADWLFAIARIDRTRHNSRYRTKLVLEYTGCSLAERQILLPVDAVKPLLEYPVDSSGDYVGVIE